ncbi:MAG: hypothetical protein HDR19_03030 [Lachnospiraceae bacterium]|nr:hypothetical protein [Lachnospiraceae bacterium]
MMRKKYFMGILFTACVLSGCAQSVVAEEQRLGEETISEETFIAESRVEETMDYNDTQTKEENKVYTDCSYEALKEFSYQLFRENTEEENPVLSPVSAYIALSMVGIGAQNGTQEEFTSVLGDYADITAICDNVMTTLPTSSENTTVTLANSVWVDDAFTVYDDWLADTTSTMRSEVFNINLSDFDVVGKMNDWVKRNTNGLIEDIVDGPFDDSASLALFNTLYFKAKWENSFASESVYEDTFYTEDKNEQNTQMMHKESELQYIANDFAEGVILPYRNMEEGDGNFAFVALKPIDEDTAIRDVCDELTETVIEEMLLNKQIIRINLKLPKFEMSFDKELNESLEKMGLKSAFNAASADFGGIGESSLGPQGNNLYIDLVRQKAKIIVDEEGTEAAAATGIMMRFAAARPQEAKDVWFDRPFVYLIMDMDKEIPLFIGIFDRPMGL